ncbi:hypothetical protein [Dickeya lacustris]|uniref:Uncharacterized protein n=1 Tax=Dickeya lacustris TaxID=2259638 RepID=A0ABY8G6Z2_9GAMM|nr:hypothetical protein [Dickeya lacustris]WFN55728.1 hypothetical protein O1Q98_19535 [Dickeya lacustris]
MNTTKKINSTFHLETIDYDDFIHPSPLVKVQLSVGDSASNGITINTYGQGQCSGVTYTVPPHAVIDVDFEIKLQCITPAGIQTMNELIKSLLDASKRHEYEENSKKTASGGISFLPFFGSAKASYEETKHTMEKWGLTEKSQDLIVEKMLELSNQLNVLKYKGTIFNKDYDYAVTGNIFAVVMDCTIKKDEQSSQQRYIGPTIHMSGEGGEVLPTTEKLY